MPAARTAALLARRPQRGSRSLLLGDDRRLETELAHVRAVFACDDGKAQQRSAAHHDAAFVGTARDLFISRPGLHAGDVIKPTTIRIRGKRVAAQEFWFAEQPKP